MAFDVLSRATSVVGSRLLEASAGTGKTFTIEHLVVRLLLEKEPFRLEEILVMTFTRAATRELRQRILRRLQLTREQLKKREGLPDFLEARLESHPQTFEEMVRALDRAISCFEDAQITTIHAFASRVLATHGLLAGLAPQGQKDEIEDFETRERALVSVWKELLKPPAYSAAQARLVMRGLFTRGEDFLREFLADLSPMAQRSPIKNGAELLAEFQQALSELADPQVDVQQLYREVTALLPFYNKAKDPALLESVHLVAGMVLEGSCRSEQFDELLLRELFLEKLVPENRNKARKDPPEFSSLLLKMQQKLLPPLLQAKDSKLLYTRLLLDSQEALSREGTSSPDQLLLQLRRAINSSEFCQQVACSYRAVILDEFQDTDRIQWEIFERLFVQATPPPVIYLVGDPKQSIYRFRSADVYTYLAAAKALGGETPALLETNFRSTPALVESLNALFIRAGEGLFPLPRAAGQGLAFHPVKAASQTALSPLEDGKRALHLVVPEARATNESMQRDYFLPFLLREVVLLAERGHPFSEMAVLVRDWSQAREVSAALKSAGISAELRKKELPAGLASYQWILALLELLIQPHDEGRLRFFLMNPLVGWPLENSSFQEARSLWQAIYNLWEEGKRSRFFQQILDAKWHSGLSVRMRAGHRDWEGADLEIRSWIALLLGQQREGKDDPLALRFFLLSYAEDAEKAAKVMGASEGGGGVQILTGHMSKGLEFPIVFAWGLMKRSRSSCRVITCPMGRLLPHSPESPEALLHHAEERAERLRQLYVVLTRAKKRVYLPLPRFSTKPNAATDLCSAELLLEACKEEDPLLFAQKLDQEGVASYERLTPSVEEIECSIKSEALQLYMKPPPPMHFKSWAIISFSSQVADLPGHSFRKEGEDLLGSGKEVGTLLHEILADLFRGRLQKQELSEKLSMRLKNTLLAGKEKLVEELIERNLKIRLGRKTLKEISPSRCQVEMSFFMKEQEERRIGFIDLFFEEDGRYYMVDWKSHFLGNCDEDYSEKRLAEVVAAHRYDLQAEGYTRALAKYLALFDPRPFEQLFGGMFFVFLRGAKVWRHG